jgi:hypothetical protein
MLVSKHIPDADMHIIGERAQKSDVPLDFVFTSSQGQDADLVDPSSLNFDEKAIPLGMTDLAGDVCDAVEQEGAYAPPSGDGTGDAGDSDVSSSEEDSDSEEEDEYNDDDDSDDGYEMDDDDVDGDVLQQY